MKRVHVLGIAVMLCGAAIVACSTPQVHETLVTGHDETPPMSFAQAVGSFPVNLAVTADGRFAVSTDAGFRQSLHVLRMMDGKSVAQLDYPNKPAPGEHIGEDVAAPVVKTNGLYYGLAIGADSTLYAAQGANDSIAVIALGNNGEMTPRESIRTRANDFPAGLAVDGRGFLYVANQAAWGSVTQPFEASGSVAVYDASRKEVGRYTFKDSFFGTTNYPLAIAVLPDGSKTYVASERDGGVYVLNTSDAKAPTLVKKIETGALPTALLLSKDHGTLFVANADSDTVSVVRAADDAVTATVALRPDVARTLPGATPIALALSPDEKTLFVALGDMNAIAAVDVAAAQVRGYFPTGWYPSALAITEGGKSLLVLNAKGTAAHTTNNPHQSPLNLLEGNAQIVRIPSEKDRAAATAQVLANNHYERLMQQVPEPLASITRKSGKITHVIYIIKENRTYDELLGDMPEGNGDPALCLFPKAVTPNLHALASRFGILDNLYACGEVSGDGWNWSTESMANSYVERNIPYHYSFRGRKYDFEGSNNGYPTGGVPNAGPDGQPAATAPFFKDGAPAIPDVAAAPGGHLWDMCNAHGVPLRNYGFYSYSSEKLMGVAGGPDNFPTVPGLMPAGRDLEGKSDLDFRRFDLDYPDSDAPAMLAAKTGDPAFLFEEKTYGKQNAECRFAEWNREFQMMLKKDPTGAAVPAMVLLRIPNDHTLGTKPGKHSPTAYVADNDFAVGEIVDAVSHSAIWEHTAIFVVEDDAQSGPDHVDCHRMPGYVISPYMGTNGAVRADHRFYNTNSFLRTMEVLLDLPPMTQYDGTATLIQGWTAPANNAPYLAVMPEQKYFAQVNSEEKKATSPAAARAAADSNAMDFTHEDAAPAQRLNEIIWLSVKGADSPMPAPRTGKLLPVDKKHDDDKDDDDD